MSQYQFQPSPFPPPGYAPVRKRGSPHKTNMEAARAQRRLRFQDTDNSAYRRRNEGIGKLFLERLGLVVCRSPQPERIGQKLADDGWHIIDGHMFTKLVARLGRRSGGCRIIGFQKMDGARRTNKAYSIAWACPHVAIQLHSLACRGDASLSASANVKQPHNQLG